MVNSSIYPIVIEPSADIIHLTVPDGFAKFPTECQRISAESVHATVGDLPVELVNFFAPTPIDTTLQVLCYTVNGQLSLIMYRQPGTSIWEAQDVISLIKEGQIGMPEVRVIFQTDRARAAFLYYLESIQKGTVICPSLAVVLDKTVCAPISCQTDEH